MSERKKYAIVDFRRCKGCPNSDTPFRSDSKGCGLNNSLEKGKVPFEVRYGVPEQDSTVVCHTNPGDGEPGYVVLNQSYAQNFDMLQEDEARVRSNMPRVRIDIV